MLVNGVIVHAPYEVSVRQMALPDPAPNDVAVRVTACGLCTWEQRVYRGRKPTYPFWGGHEVCGIVESVGSESQSPVREGDAVALALMYRCGTCRYCRAGLDNHCAYLHRAPADGLPSGPRGLSSHIIARPYQVIPIDASLGSRGALLEPLACTLRSIRRSHVKTGQLAVVIGTGTLGLMHVAALATMGIRVLACDPVKPAAEKLAIARAHEQLDGYPEEVVDKVCGDGGADCVFCIRGGSLWINAAVQMCARGGTVVLFQSIPESDLTSLAMNNIHSREISIVGTVSQRLEDFAQAAELTRLNPGLWDSLAVVTVPHSDPHTAFEKSIENAINRVLVTFSE